jgi:hypothetical protein
VRAEVIPSAASSTPSTSARAAAAAEAAIDRLADMAKGIPLDIGLRVGASLGSSRSSGERRESLLLPSASPFGGLTTFPPTHNVHAYDGGAVDVLDDEGIWNTGVVVDVGDEADDMVNARWRN